MLFALFLFCVRPEYVTPTGAPEVDFMLLPFAESYLIDFWNTTGNKL